ncbi:saccharopine dehydrogenase-like oxidoreductase [Uloborus diversus]|uniref:saccharopine dehydrogenase-like oxidoreductase n=1 Tax=Uloborus diversus TaxID=327109 RepID=UPI00240A287E|nr:saccharopine dehydrogenase-like oxidoreductase [Uloborus diversus]
MAAEKRKYDIAVFGASGVTGQYIIEELALHGQNVTWCVAGRNPEKLKQILSESSEFVGKNLNSIEIMTADVSDDSSLANMCKSSKIILNCVGPYRFYGEKVVEHCIRHGTHHIDVSGEPQYLETVQVKYFKEAQEKNLYIIGACGFDSIPCDLGVEVLRKKFNGDLNSVETYMIINRPPGSSVNFATWQSAIYGLAHADELIPLRKALREKLFTKEMPKPSYYLKKRPTLFNSKDAGGWCLPFIGSDKSVVLRTQMYNHQFKNEKPIQVQTYMKTYSLFYALVTMLMGGIFMLMTKFSVGCYLLEKFPEMFSLGTFSRTPSTRDEASNGSFKIIFKAKGWSEKLLDSTDKHVEPPNKELIATVEGPDPGYITTAICMVNAALVVLNEADKLPESGGVFTPGAAFSDTSLVSRMESRGIKINIQ